eukprot:COSAG01_NODE_11707_length_1876_cov_1.516601_2_plen_93_part_00
MTLLNDAPCPPFTSHCASILCVGCPLSAAAIIPGANKRSRPAEGEEEGFVDKPLLCRDCRQDFIWTAGQQLFYHDKGFTNAPTRCPVGASLY